MKKEIIETLVGKVIKVDGGKDESTIGKIIDVGEDYFILVTESDGVVYYKSHHIKSFTENTKNNFKFDLDIPKDLDYKKAANFKDLLISLQYQWINLNYGGDEKLEGVLDKVGEGYITIVKNEKVIRLAPHHIRSISYGL